MLGIAEAVTGAVQGIGNLGLGIYNAYQQTRNYNYQKSLQKEIFKREDTAIQRQVADAEKAGFNKFAVMGNNGAGTGSVVSTTAPQADSSMAGSAVDAINAMYTLSQQKESAKQARLQTEQAQLVNKDLRNKVFEQSWRVANSVAQYMRDAGFEVKGFGQNGDDVTVYFNGARSNPKLGEISDYAGSPGESYYNVDLENAKNRMTTLQTEANWSQVNQIVNLISRLLGGAQSAGNAYDRFRPRR